MYSKIVFNLLLMVCLSIVQVSFLSGLPGWFMNMNAVIVVLVLILGFGGLIQACTWALGVGLFLDIYGFLPFGVNVVALTGMILVVNFLLNNFFTNRSMYSLLMLVFSASFFNEFFLYISTLVLYIVSAVAEVPMMNFGVIAMEMKGVFLNLLLLIILFNLLNYFSGRYKPVFLMKR